MSNSRPRLTIGMPVHNGERYLSEALDSLLSQTFSDFELIISDNASTDGTERVSREYVEKDPRVRYLRREENTGATRNFNGVLELSSAPYFKWAATDDLCAPDFLRRSVEVLDRDPSVVLAYAKTSYIDENGRLLDRIGFELRSHSPNAYQRFRDLVCVAHDCVAIFGVFRRKALDRTSLLGNYVSSDRVLLAQLSLLGKLHMVPEPLFFRRIHPSASMVKHPSPHARSGWFDAAREGRPVFPAWRIFFEYLAAVYRSPLDWNQKMLCYPQMARWLRWNWRRLVKDLSVFGRHLLYPELELYRHRAGSAVASSPLPDSGRRHCGAGQEMTRRMVRTGGSN